MTSCVPSNPPPSLLSVPGLRVSPVCRVSPGERSEDTWEHGPKEEQKTSVGPEGSIKEVQRISIDVTPYKVSVLSTGARVHRRFEVGEGLRYPRSRLSTLKSGVLPDTERTDVVPREGKTIKVFRCCITLFVDTRAVGTNRLLLCKN